MQFMLDMNVCIDLMRGDAARIFERMRRHEIEEIDISSVTLAGCVDNSREKAE